MTGLELIKWIIKNDAEDKEIIVEHRDEGGSYRTAERIGEFSDPMLVMFSEEDHGIVRCKDCKYCKYPKSEYWCEQGHLHGNAETWFCADGERR